MFFDEVDPNGPILGFQGDYRFLSNFAQAWVEMDGMLFTSVEHAYQAAKSPPEAIVGRELFSSKNKLTAGQAKRLGKQLPIREDWDVIKLNRMHFLVEQKFRKHRHLADMLMSTGDRKIYELNSWGDTYWGVVQDAQGRLAGGNRLGQILENDSFQTPERYTMTLVGKILIVAVALGCLYGTYTIGYYRGAKAAIETTLDLAAKKDIDITKMLLTD